MGNSPRERPHGARKSSFGLIDPDIVFGELGLKRGMTLLDLCCGRGEYSVAASRIIGGEGRVYAVDLWEEGINSLLKEVSARNIKNLKAMVADVGKRVPLDDSIVDLCFIATAFHDLVLADVAERALSEVVRVLKRGGHLAILEFKKIDGPPGPPLSSRLAPEEVEKKVKPYGFDRERFAEHAPYTYLIVFRNPRGAL